MKKPVAIFPTYCRLSVFVLFGTLLGGSAPAGDGSDPVKPKVGDKAPVSYLDFPPADLGPGAASPVRAAIERYQSDTQALSRSLPLRQSAGRREKMKKLAQDWLSLLEKGDYDGYELDGKIDYQLLRNQIRHEIRQIDIEAKEAEEFASLVPFSRSITDLVESGVRLDPIEPAKAAEALNSLTKEIAKAQRDVRDPPAAKSAPSSRHGACGHRATSPSSSARWPPGTPTATATIRFTLGGPMNLTKRLINRSTTTGERSASALSACARPSPALKRREPAAAAVADRAAAGVSAAAVEEGLAAEAPGSLDRASRTRPRRKTRSLAIRSAAKRSWPSSNTR